MENNKTQTSKFNKVCVFCGSKFGNKKAFSDAALDLGNELVRRRIDLVYGGGSVGLMGLISQKVYDGGCHVLGVIPTTLVPIEMKERTFLALILINSSPLSAKLKTCISWVLKRTQNLECLPQNFNSED